MKKIIVNRFKFILFCSLLISNIYNIANIKNKILFNINYGSLKIFFILLSENLLVFLIVTAFFYLFIFKMVR